MLQLIQKHIPEYIDDRLTLNIVLSDDITYKSYNLIQGYLVSSYYDDDKDCAFTVTDITQVPDKFKNTLVQHANSTTTASIMYPNSNFQIKQATSDKKFGFKEFPEYDGEYFKVYWDYGQNNNAVSCYNQSSNISDFYHIYENYGEHIIKFSPNIKKLDIHTYQNGSTYSNDRIKSIKSRSPNLLELKNLSYSYNLTNMSLNAVSSINTYWYDCYELTSIYLPDLEDIAAAYAVNCMTNLKKFYAPKLKRISKATGVFKGDISLQEIYFPELTAIDGGNGYTFMTNVSLSVAYCPKLIKGMKQDFSFCVNLKKTDFSNLSAIETDMFRQCLSLKDIKFPSVKYIYSNAFVGCQNLQKIDLSEVKTVPVLENINAFTGLPSDYKILIKKSLSAEFNNAPNWSLIKMHFKLI